MITIDDVVWKILVAIYSNEILSEKLFLKGGQALRVVEGLNSRFSKDSDFSIIDSIQDSDPLFEYLESAIKAEFHKEKLFVIDFKYTRKPKYKKEGSPDFWRGWAVEFKIITAEQLMLPKDKQSASALIPEGSVTNKIPIDISEMEYCGSFEKVKIKSIEIKTYSKVLLILEKLRAICQSHPKYELRNKKSNRARDFYDIEQLYSKILSEGNMNEFLKECSSHIENVFNAKKVPLSLLKEAIEDKDFINSQEIGWEEVKATVRQLNEPFSYYLQTIKSIVAQIV